MVPAFFPVNKASRNLVNHSRPSGDEVKNEWSYTSTPPPIILNGVDSGKFTFIIIITIIIIVAWGGVVVKRCATSRTVPGSIPGGVTGFFSDIFLPTVPWPWGRLRP